MDSLCYDQGVYKKLLPVPKTHLFMKKMAKIQAIDRQIRKKWMKIKRDNEKQHLILNDDQNSDMFKRESIQSHAQIQFMPIRDHSQIKNVQNSLKREQILKNHKKHEQIFYGRKKKARLISQNSIIESTLTNQTKDYISVAFDSPRRRIKTQITIQKHPKLKISDSIFDNPNELSTSPQKSASSHKFLNLQMKVTNQIKLPKMLLKRSPHKKRQMSILSTQSQKELIQLSEKKRQNMSEWVDHRRNLFDKLKGSKAYYIMKSPTKFQLSQGEEIYIV